MNTGENQKFCRLLESLPTEVLEKLHDPFSDNPEVFHDLLSICGMNKRNYDLKFEAYLPYILFERLKKQ